MDKYVEYAKGNDLKGEMPLYMQPNRKISVQDVMNGMRDHYEGTPFDIQNELGAGPYNMPYHPTPLSWKDGDKSYFNERPVSTQQTAFCFVGQMRSDLPDAVGGIAWVTNDDPNMAPFVPLYCSIATMPECFQRIEGKQDDVTFSWDSAFWLQNTISNMVYPYYEKMFPDLKAKRDQLETKFFDDAKKSLAWANLTDSEQIKKNTTDQSQAAAAYMMNKWTDLFKFLVVKHLDMALKSVDEQGNFKKTEHGLVEPPARPGYPEAFRKQIEKATGDKYLMKE